MRISCADYRCWKQEAPRMRAAAIVLALTVSAAACTAEFSVPGPHQHRGNLTAHAAQGPVMPGTLGLTHQHRLRRDAAAAGSEAKNGSHDLGGISIELEDKPGDPKPPHPDTLLHDKGQPLIRTGVLWSGDKSALMPAAHGDSPGPPNGDGRGAAARPGRVLAARHRDAALTGIKAKLAQRAEQDRSEKEAARAKIRAKPQDFMVVGQVHDEAGARLEHDPLDIAAEPLDEDRIGLASTEGCAIYVLDLGALAVTLGYPRCSTDHVATDPEFGTLLPNASAVVPGFNTTPPMPTYKHVFPWFTAPHFQSLYAGPWYVYQTLLNSPARVDDPAEAHLIYVFDYCHVAASIAEHNGHFHWRALWSRARAEQGWVKAHVNLNAAPSKALLAAYSVMTKMKQWRERGGKDFVFFHPHPSFTLGDEGTTGRFYQNVMCKRFAGSLHLVVERFQRWRCPGYHEGRTVIVPHSGSEYVHAWLAKDIRGGSIHGAKRDIIVFFRGRCAPLDSVAMRMRHAFVGAVRSATSASACCLGEEDDPTLRCTKEEAHGGGGAPGWHRDMLATMERSRFCVILPGDSQSSQRIVDAYVTGCIPVFIGPPFHTMPFGRHVDYSASSLFIELTETASWFEGASIPHSMNPRTASKHKGADGDWWHPRWWLPDVRGVKIMRLRSMEQVNKYLHSVAPEEADELYANVLRQRTMFIYSQQPASPPSASDVVIDSMCQYALSGYTGSHINLYEEVEDNLYRAHKRRWSRYRATAQRAATG